MMMMMMRARWPKTAVVSTIELDVAVLASPNTTDEEKFAALKFLCHWGAPSTVPARRSQDRSGDDVPTRGSSCGSLHTLCDSCLVEERL